MQRFDHTQFEGKDGYLSFLKKCRYSDVSPRITRVSSGQKEAGKMRAALFLEKIG